MSATTVTEALATEMGSGWAGQRWDDTRPDGLLAANVEHRHPIDDLEAAIEAGWVERTGPHSSDRIRVTRAGYEAIGWDVQEIDTPQATVCSIHAPEGWMVPVGLAEIAAELGVRRVTVDRWRQRDLLPEPRWTVGGRPAWSLHDILRWARETDRLT